MPKYAKAVAVAVGLLVVALSVAAPVMAYHGVVALMVTHAGITGLACVRHHAQVCD